jgi:hypothetical protein
MFLFLFDQKVPIYQENKMLRQHVKIKNNSVIFTASTTFAN